MELIWSSSPTGLAQAHGIALLARLESPLVSRARHLSLPHTTHTHATLSLLRSGASRSSTCTMYMSHVHVHVALADRLAPTRTPPLDAPAPRMRHHGATRPSVGHIQVRPGRTHAARAVEGQVGIHEDPHPSRGTSPHNSGEAPPPHLEARPSARVRVRGRPGAGLSDRTRTERHGAPEPGAPSPARHAARA